MHMSGDIVFIGAYNPVDACSSQSDCTSRVSVVVMVTIIASFLLSSFTLWALLFVIARLLTLTLSVLTFGFGLPRTENQGFSLAEGNFNVLTIRQVPTPVYRGQPFVFS